MRGSELFKECREDHGPFLFFAQQRIEIVFQLGRDVMKGTQRVRGEQRITSADVGVGACAD